MIKNIALIPARSGSKGIKNKNLRKVNGKSLVKRTYDHAKESLIFEKIILSTDSLTIAQEIDSKISVELFDNNFDNIFEIDSQALVHHRNPTMAHDLSPIRDLLFFIAKNIEFENLWMLQPTTPFRLNSEFLEINNTANYLEKQSVEWSSIVSCRLLTDVHPDRMLKIIDGFAHPILEAPLVDNIPRQLLEPVFVKDGGFYLLKRNNLLNRIMLGSKIVPYIRSGYKTINIDSLLDLRKAQKVRIN